MASDAAASGDVEMLDVHAPDMDVRQAMHGNDIELDEKYPNRPHNYGKTPPFRDLFLTLLNPLNENKSAGPFAPRRRIGVHGPAHLSPQEVRRSIIEKFVSRWRKEVGDDIYPVFRLILPDKDADRPMYGLKEKMIAKLLIKTIKISEHSEDGYNLLNWRQPGQGFGKMAGDFPGRCYEVISRRPIRIHPGNMTIEEVNANLDNLSLQSKEVDQLPIFQNFYQQMNAEEMMWLIRIILRQMKIGATEKTIFGVWHPDAEQLFNVSSSLRRVCWELHDPAVRLETERRGITLMQCFQPQLAQFQMHSLEKMVKKLTANDGDDEFWIEEKLDGERIQLHMLEDDTIPGGKRFGFWSRKAKDYTYLYGNGFEDENSALTRHIKNCFHEGVHNIILDGEMITWDPERDTIVPFGSLKSAALAQQQNPFSADQRPLYRVFDILYLNNEDITRYTLRDRRRALEASVYSIPRRIEVHSYTSAHSTSEIEPLLRKVVAEASEGLVLKNPRSMYRPNDRNDDWMKVKPDYMTEFGESLDCIIIGGYYGSGRRGGTLSSFLCGLRVDENHIAQGANPQKCYSFFRVGGGMSVQDYAAIRHKTDSKWHDWDRKHPPTDVIELAGGERQYEQPDVWIYPSDSVVVEVKGASVTATDQFRMGLTLRFPRFKRLRSDKTWEQALSIQEFINLKQNIEAGIQEKEFKIDEARKQKRRRIGRLKKPLTIAGQTPTLSLFNQREEEPTPLTSNLFKNLTFCVLTDCPAPNRLPKSSLESLIKAHGGSVTQSTKSTQDVVCLAARRTVHVASLQKHNDVTLIHPFYIFDCIVQAEIDVQRGRNAGAFGYLLPLEELHVFHTSSTDAEKITRTVAKSTDAYGDSFARDLTMPMLRQLLDSMTLEFEVKRHHLDVHAIRARVLDELEESRATLFRDLCIYMPVPTVNDGDTTDFQNNHSLCPGTSEALVRNYVRFGGGKFVDTHDENVATGRVTHVVINDSMSIQDVRALRAKVAESMALNAVPHFVYTGWVFESWAAHTRINEELFTA